MAKKRKKKTDAGGHGRANPAGWLIWGGIPLLIITFFYLIRARPEVCALIAHRISYPYRAFMGRLTSKIPFSVAEVLICAAIIGVVVYIILSVRKIIRSQSRLRVFLRRFGALLIAALWMLSMYCMLFGVEYLAPGFAAENGLETGGVTVEELYSVTKYFAENASRLAPEVERDEFGAYVADDAVLFRYSEFVYEGLIGEFPALDARWLRPKPMFFSKLFSIMGFTGMYFPFTGECCINTDFPASGRPFTVAHELAHSRGVIAEDEANFVGIAACLTSDMTGFEYSGYLSGYMYLENALYRTDRELWREIRSGLDEYVVRDLTENSAYWNSRQSAVTTAAETAYDSYLKSNGVDSGISSYSQCVELLVKYYVNKIR